MISIQDFAKLEIKIGTIISVEKLEGSEKLLKIIVDLGSEKRQILSGIRPYYKNIKVLIGKQVPVLTNLEPRKMMGTVSEGMILMVDGNDSVVQLHPKKKVNNGSIIR